MTSNYFDSALDQNQNETETSESIGIQKVSDYIYLLEDNFSFIHFGNNEPVQYIQSGNNAGYNSKNVKTYFEITIDSLHLAAGTVALGFADGKVYEDEFLGSTKNSYGYFSDGIAIHNQTKKSFGFQYGAGDTIGCAVIVDSENKKRIFYTLNGNFLGSPESWEALELTETLYPTISINCQGKISTNFGQKPFVYNLIEKPDFDVNNITVMSEKPVNNTVKENKTKN